MAQVDGGQLLSEVERVFPKLGVLLRTVYQPAINNLAQNSGVDPIGNSETPQAPNGINIKTAGEMVHVTLADNNVLKKGTENFVEMDTDPSFSQPHVEHLGASRGRFIQLPANDDGGTQHSWYFRTYTQKQGSLPSEKVVYGGNSPIPVKLTGTTNMTPLASTGSGTANGNGQSGGSGFGRVVIRQAPAPKRSVGG